MRLRHIIHAKKCVSDWGAWRAGAMPRSAFPLSMARRSFYRHGGGYRWRVVQFQCLWGSFRLLIVIHSVTEQFRGMLGMTVGQDTRLIGTYEFHDTHPGWHAVVSCGELELVPTGIKAGPWQRRLPAASSIHRRLTFGTTQETATRKAGKFFRLPTEPLESGPTESIR